MVPPAAHHPARPYVTPLPCQVYTASLDGTMKLWNYQEGECMRTYTFHEPVESLVCVGEAPGAGRGLSHLR